MLYTNDVQHLYHIFSFVDSLEQPDIELSSSVRRMYALRTFIYNNTRFRRGQMVFNTISSKP